MALSETSIGRDMDGVQALIMKLGGLVEQAFVDAVRALEDRDEDLAQRVRENDKRIDALEEEVNLECARVLAMRGPMGRDLRVVLSILKIGANLERCGDYSKNLAKRTTALVQMNPIDGAISSIRRMAREVEMMMKDALDAFANQDADLASNVRLRDQEVDQMYNALFRELLTHMMEDPRNITACMHLHFIAKNIERMGDHMTSISEQVIYIVTGSLPDDQRPRGDKTSLISDDDA